VTFDSHIQRGLHELEAAGLLRSPRTVHGPHAAELIIDGRSVIGLCSNDYLGLAGHPELSRAAAAALTPFGFGAGASRHISGTSALHVQLEQRLARFVGHPAALLFATGYAANVGVIPAIAGRGDVVFSDSLNHASLIDGARLSRAQVVVYRHLDLDHLEQLLAAHRSHHANALVLTESVFSMEGDCADLTRLRALCDQYDCGLLVDEAHALGVVGPEGRGLCARQSVRADVLVGTLGKAFGCAGAFVAGAPDTVRLVQNRARSFIFSTAPPPALAAAALAATELVEAANDRRTRVLHSADRLRRGLAALGYRVQPGVTPILPVLIGATSATMELSAALLERGIFVHGIRPPTVPPDTCRLRVTATAAHTDAQLDRAIEAFAACRNLL
jgi:8-amino-7-oxononanoate synthase